MRTVECMRLNTRGSELSDSIKQSSYDLGRTKETGRIKHRSALCYKIRSPEDRNTASSEFDACQQPIRLFAHRLVLLLRLVRHPANGNRRQRMVTSVKQPRRTR